MTPDRRPHPGPGHSRDFRRLHGPRRPGATLTALTALAVFLLTAVTACGDPGDLRPAGSTPTAVGPMRLWPEVPPASTPALDYGEADTEKVKGVRASGDDIHRVDPLDVVRAEVAAHPGEYSGPHALYAQTAERLRDCGAKGARGRKCPVLQAYYRDLTGDGRDDMVLGIRFPGNQLAVRVYTFMRHELIQIMATSDSTAGVELAGRAVIIRSPSTLPGYEYRTVWTWDRHQHAMLATRDEILRVGTPSPSGSPEPSRSRPPVPSPSRTPVLPSESGS